MRASRHIAHRINSSVSALIRAPIVEEIAAGGSGRAPLATLPSILARWTMVVAEAADVYGEALRLAASRRYGEALILARLAALQGRPEAQRMVGEMLFYGQAAFGPGVALNRREAGHWLFLAARQGSLIAAYYLDKYYLAPNRTEQEGGGAPINT